MLQNPLVVLKKPSFLPQCILIAALWSKNLKNPSLNRVNEINNILTPEQFQKDPTKAHRTITWSTIARLLSD